MTIVALDMSKVRSEVPDSLLSRTPHLLIRPVPIMCDAPFRTPSLRDPIEVSVVKVRRDIDPLLLIFEPGSCRHVRFEHVVVIPRVREIDGRRAVPLQEGVREGLRISLGHLKVATAITLVRSLSLDRGTGVVEMDLEEMSVGERVTDGMENDFCDSVFPDQVPRSVLAPAHDGDGNPRVEVWAPLVEVDNDTAGLPA